MKEERIVKLEHKYPITIGLIADMHCGTTRALMLDEYTTLEGQTIKANKVQQILHRHWLRVSKIFKKYKIKYLFNVGDAFGGLNPRQDGAYRFLKNPDQIELATQLLLEMLGDRKDEVVVLNWRGTDYHETKPGSGEMHLELTKRLQAEGVASEFMGEAAYIEIEGKKRLRRLFVAHETPVALVYPATLMSREIDWCLKSKATKDTLPVDALIRAHIHRWLHVDHDGVHAVQLPCWQAHVPYKISTRYFFRLQPSIGGVLLLVDEEGRLRFWHFLLDETEREQLAREVIKIKPISLTRWEEDLKWKPRPLKNGEKSILKNREY